jgi:Domain of unknown function (DUF336).
LNRGHDTSTWQARQRSNRYPAVFFCVPGGLGENLAGKIIGAIGVSGVNPPQDGVVAKAGAEALK